MSSPVVRSRGGLFALLCVCTLAGFAVVPYLVFLYAPTMMDHAGSPRFFQKIFYFHVPCAWSMFLAAGLAAVGGGASLWRGRRWGDRLCAAASELAVVYGVLVLFTGPLWAKKAWGHFWVWDVRLTTVLILFLTFVAVLLALRYAGPARRRVAAGLSLFGAVNVPLVYVSVNLWRGQHPPTSYTDGMTFKVRIAFFSSLALFTVLFALLLWIRLKLERSRDQVDDLVVAMEERGSGDSR